ncbi:hypothetical protein BGW80DRAFT_853916 [Lactifluus volemus]|nr:hypothetical protein BGW80DRAFT_853916 [Lactifluus volemus]
MHAHTRQVVSIREDTGGPPFLWWAFLLSCRRKGLFKARLYRSTVGKRVSTHWAPIGWYLDRARRKRLPQVARYHRSVATGGVRGALRMVGCGVNVDAGGAGPERPRA